MAADLKSKGQSRNSKGIIGSPGKKEKKPPSYSEASQGSTTKGKAGYKSFTEDEREDWKVTHGIAPTSEDPSAIGQATREAAKAAHARGELSDEDRRDQGIVEVRELDEAKYNTKLEAARTARANLDSISSNKMSGSSVFANRAKEGTGFGTSSPVAAVVSSIRSKAKLKKSRLNPSGFEDTVFSADLMPKTGSGL